LKAAIRKSYGGPDVVEVVEIEKPHPQGDEVLVEVHATSINTADLDHLFGRPRLVRLFTGLRRPRVARLGLDVAGVVVAVGDGVTRFSPGDEVWADMFAGGYGGFAEYVCASERAFVHMPAGLSFVDAATVPHSAVLALQALEGRGPIRPRARVLINGAGGMVGPWAIQLAKVLGASHVTGVDAPDRFDLMRRAGADELIDYTAEDFRDRGERYDLIVDIAATRSVLSFRRALTGGGTYMLVARGLFGFFQAAVVGGIVSLFGSKHMGVFGWVPSRAKELDRIGAMIDAGEVRPIIDRVVPFEQVAEALDLVHRRVPGGKIVVAVR
jgi:NADPH:quinone reductase-like Zn-dependent oxidoreductase